MRASSAPWTGLLEPPEEGSRDSRLSPLTGVCCEGSPERLVDPCLELNLFHDSANLPRLALRLRLRLSALSSRSEQPRSISPASLHFLPMLSWCGQAGRRPAPLAVLAAVGTQLSTTPPSPGRLPPRSPALCTAARRLRLRPRLVQQGLGLRAPPVPQSASSYTQIAFHPQPPPSHDRGEGITQPTPGVVDVQLWEFLAVTTPLPVSRPLGLGSRSLGRLLVGGDSS